VEPRLTWNHTKKGRERLERERAMVARLFPGLEFGDAGDDVVLAGTIAVVQDSGERDVVAVELQFPPDYPRHEPLAKEAGNRFVRSDDNHINRDGTFCLWTPEDSPWRGRDPNALERFLEHLVVYLDKQLVYEVTRTWPGAYRAHGEAGRDEALQEIAECDRHAAQLAHRIVTHGKGSIGRKARCPCGSDLDFDKCHRREAIRAASVLTELLRARN